MIESLAQEIFAHLKAARLVLLVLHRRPDPDSLGSASALASFLDAKGIPYLYFCSSGLPLEAAGFGIDAAYVLSGEALKKAPVECICTFDAGDLKIAGLESVFDSAEDDDKVRPYLINFDHHITNTRFGDLNVIDSACASTTEMLYRFFAALGWEIPPRTAYYLLGGLLFDTDHFFNPATSSFALEMASELMGRGVTLTGLRQFLFERRGLSALRLIGEALTRLRKHPRHSIAVTYLTEEDAKKCGASFEEIEGIANILNAVGDAKAMLLLKFGQGFIRGSFRTTAEDVDLGRLAALFGGGGHRKAAGFTIRGKLTEDSGRVKIV